MPSVWTFTGGKGERVFYDRLGSGSNAYATLYGPNGANIDSGSGTFDATLPGDGSYVLVVQGTNSNGTPAAYNFRLNAFTTRPTDALSFGQEVTFDPTNPGSPTATRIPGANVLTAVSCSSDMQCVAVDSVGA